MMNRQEAGRLGGLATKEKYGMDFFRINGARGGRPRSSMLNEVRQQSAPIVSQNNFKKEELATSGNLKHLKTLWEEKGGGLNAANCSPQGG